MAKLTKEWKAIEESFAKSSNEEVFKFLLHSYSQEYRALNPVGVVVFQIKLLIMLARRLDLISDLNWLDELERKIDEAATLSDEYLAEAGAFKTDGTVN